MTNDRQLQKPRTSAANAVQDARAAEVTPHTAVAGVQGGNTTGALALRRSRRRRGGKFDTYCLFYSARCVSCSRGTEQYRLWSERPSSRQISVFKGEHQHLLIAHLDYKGSTADLASTQSSGTS